MTYDEALEVTRDAIGVLARREGIPEDLIELAPGLPVRTVEAAEGVLPAGVAAIVGAFGEIARAQREGRPINPRAFVVLRDDGRQS